MWCCLLDVYTKFQLDIWKHVEKGPENCCWKEALLVFLFARGPKLEQPQRKEVGLKTLHLLSKYLCKIWGLYIIFWYYEFRKMTLTYFCGWKEGQNVLIGIILEHYLWGSLFNLYTHFIIDIWKHVEKVLKTFEKSKMHRSNCHNSENKKGMYVKKYAAGHLCTKFEGFILIYEAMIAKNDFDLPLAVK